MQIAKALCMSGGPVSRCLLLPEVREAVEEERRLRSRTSRLKIEALGGRAVERLQELMESPDHQVAIRAVVAVLDRIGIDSGSGAIPDAPTTVEPTTPEEIGAILDRIPEAMLQAAIARRQG